MQATEAPRQASPEVQLLLDLGFAPATAKHTCGQCGGSGSVLVDPSDRRKGETSCGNCGGEGEL